jgi:hypothetical protein
MRSHRDFESRVSVTRRLLSRQRRCRMPRACRYGVRRRDLRRPVHLRSRDDVFHSSAIGRCLRARLPPRRGVRQSHDLHADTARGRWRNDRVRRLPRLRSDRSFGGRLPSRSRVYSLSARRGRFHDDLHGVGRFGRRRSLRLSLLVWTGLLLCGRAGHVRCVPACLSHWIDVPEWPRLRGHRRGRVGPLPLVRATSPSVRSCPRVARSDRSPRR